MRRILLGFIVIVASITTSIVDYVGERFKIHQRYVSNAGKEWLTAIEAGDSNSGFSTIAYMEEAPVVTTQSASYSRDVMTRELRTYPEAILRAALRRPATLQWIGEARIGGKLAQVISFVDADANSVALSFDAQTKLLVRSEVLNEHPYLGQAVAASVYLDYRKTGALLLHIAWSCGGTKSRCDSAGSHESS